MTDAVFDFKAINRNLNRQEQKAEYEANNPKEEQSAYGYLYGTMTPLAIDGWSGWEYDDALRMWREFVKVKI